MFLTSTQHSPATPSGESLYFLIVADFREMLLQMIMSTAELGLLSLAAESVPQHYLATIQ